MMVTRAYLISLEERVDRREIALRRCHQVGIEPIVFPAVTPAVARRMGVTWPSWLPDGQAACTVSHKVLLRRIGRDASSQRALVLEDDVMFVPDFSKRFEQIDSEIRTDCGFIQLGWLPTPAEDRASYRWRHRAAQSRSLRRVGRLIRPSIKREYLSTIVARPAFGMHCYLVSRPTAEAVSDCIGPHVFSPVDIHFQIYHDLRASFGGSAFRRTRFPLAMQDWSLGSDVEPNRFAGLPRQLDAYGRVVKLEELVKVTRHAEPKASVSEGGSGTRIRTDT